MKAWTKGMDIMSIGLVIDVTRPDTKTRPARRVPAQADLRSRYERLTALVLRVGTWLSSEEAALLSADDWDQRFLAYRQQLEELRSIGDQLRPVTLRPRHETLVGDALADEVRELFAA